MEHDICVAVFAKKVIVTINIEHTKAMEAFFHVCNNYTLRTRCIMCQVCHHSTEAMKS